MPMFDWARILTAIGQTAVIVAAGAWVLRALISHLFTRNVESYRSQIALAASKEIEEYKGLLNRLAHEHTTTYAVLQTKRSEAIAELYRLIVEAEIRIEFFLTPQQPSNAETPEERHRSAFSALRELYWFSRRHRIYFSPKLCDALDRLWHAMHGPADEAAFGIVVPTVFPDEQAENRKQQIQAWIRFRNEVPIAIQEVEAEFRRLLGVATE